MGKQMFNYNIYLTAFHSGGDLGELGK